MTSERARAILAGIETSRSDNVGKIVMPAVVYDELEEAGFIHEWDVNEVALRELASEETDS